MHPAMTMRDHSEPEIEAKKPRVHPAAVTPDDSAISAAIAHWLGLLQLLDKLSMDDRVRDGLTAVADVETSLRMFAGAMQAIRQFEHGGVTGSVKDVTEHVRKLITVPAKAQASPRVKSVKKPVTAATSIAELAAAPPPLPHEVQGASWTKSNPRPKTLAAIMQLMLDKLPSKQWATTVWVKECCQAAGIPHQFEAIKWALHTLETAGHIKRVKRNDSPTCRHASVYWEVA
jgi:hypothetical protein